MERGKRTGRKGRKTKVAVEQLTADFWERLLELRAKTGSGSWKTALQLCMRLQIALASHSCDVISTL